jgi:hypothetical protein
MMLMLMAPHVKKALLLFIVVSFTLAATVTHAQPFICEICGCSSCPPGNVMSNPSGTIPISAFPEDLLYAAPPGFTELPCALLEFIGNAGLPADQCNDELRLNPVMRQNCGCPALPGAAAKCSGLAGIPIIGLLFKLICWLFGLF